MTIQSDGDATISGLMTRDYHSEEWRVTIELSDIEYRETNGDYRDASNFNDLVDQQTFLDLAEGIDPFSGVDQHIAEDWGFEWKNLSMSLDKMGNSSSVPEDGWIGYAMPNISCPGG